MELDFISIIVIVVAILLAIVILYLIIPTLQKSCLIDKENCVTIKFQQNDDGEILLESPDGYVYWFSDDLIYAYGDYTGMSCPTITEGVPHTPSSCGLEKDGVCLCQNWDGKVCKDFEQRCDKKNSDGSCNCAIMKNGTCQDPQCSFGNAYKNYLTELKSKKCTTGTHQGAFVSSRPCFQNPQYNSNVLCGTRSDIENWVSGAKCGATICDFIYDINGETRTPMLNNVYAGTIIADDNDYTPVFAANSNTLSLVPGQVRCIRNLSYIKEKFSSYPIKTFSVYIEPNQDPTMDIYQIAKLLKELKYLK